MLSERLAEAIDDLRLGIGINSIPQVDMVVDERR